VKRLLRAVTAMLLVGGCTTAAVDSSARRGQAVLRDKAGQQVGLATLTEQAEGVQVELSAKGLPPGPKGLHIHGVGKCDPPDFASAGAHFNPTGKKHGRLNPEGSHAGDLPNLVVSADGTASIDAITGAATLRPALPGSLFGEGGTSLVIHAQADDEKTDPTGNSGARIACGAITRS
jgi:superoxide dismutase, Cu-Zn family